MNTWRKLGLGLVVTFATATAQIAAAADPPDDVQTKFSEAAALLNAGKFAEALPLLREVAAQAPDRPGPFWNLGLAAATLGEKQLALDSFLHFRELRPSDPQGFSKVIQSYQALGMLKERDAQREQIVAFRGSLPPAEREKFTTYVREQFDSAGMHFVVTEYFEPSGPLRHLYRFNALDAAQKVAYYFALESNEGTTTAARELGHIRADQRIYTLDKYEPGRHSTFAMMDVPPSYDAVRTLVVDAVEGRSKPMSSSSRELAPRVPAP